jgi:hypothetical protein
LASLAPEDRKAIVCVRAIGVTTGMCTSPNAARASLDEPARRLFAAVSRGASLSRARRRLKAAAHI